MDTVKVRMQMQAGSAGAWQTFTSMVRQESVCLTIIIEHLTIIEWIVAVAVSRYEFAIVWYWILVHNLYLHGFMIF
jgi:hypothetical protein